MRLFSFGFHSMSIRNSNVSHYYITWFSKFQQNNNYSAMQNDLLWPWKIFRMRENVRVCFRHKHCASILNSIYPIGRFEATEIHNVYYWKFKENIHFNSISYSQLKRMHQFVFDTIDSNNNNNNDLRRKQQQQNWNKNTLHNKRNKSHSRNKGIVKKSHRR